MPTYNLTLTSWADDSSIGAKPWSNPGNAQLLDGINASAGSSIVGGSHYLVGTTLSAFSPIGSLSSVVVTVNRFATIPVSGTVNEVHLYLVKGGIIQTLVDKASATNWPTTLTPAVYTFSLSDLNTLGITLSDITTSGFGVAFCVVGTATNSASVDQIAIQVNTSNVVLPSPMTIIPHQAGIRNL